MTTALAYLVVAVTCLCICHKALVPLSRRAAIALLLLPLCFTGRALLSGRVYAPIDLPFQSEPLRSLQQSFGVVEARNGILSDLYSQDIPWKAAVRYAYSHREWPLWNPFLFCGDILAASAQPTPYEPFFLFSMLLPMANSLTFLAAITFFLAGLWMFVLLRDLSCSEEASVIAAAASMYCAFLSFFVEWPIGRAVTWFPLVITGVRRVIRDRSLAAVALLAAAFSMMILNGHPETVLHTAGLGGVWAAGEIAFDRGRAFLRVAFLGIAAGTIAILLTAIFTLPILEALPQTIDHSYRVNVYAFQKKSVPFGDALRHLEFQFVPFLFGDPAVRHEWPREPPDGFPNNAYAGSVVLPFAMLGLWSHRREKWLALLLVIIGLLLGNNIAPFADIVGHLPLFRIAVNDRMIFAAAFGGAVLTGLGIDVLLQQGRRREFAMLAGITFVVLAVLCVTEWHSMRASGLSDSFLAMRTAVLLVPLVFLGLFGLLSRRTIVTSAALLFLLLVQRTIESAHFYPTLPADIFYPRIPLLDRLPQTAELYRTVGYGLVFYPNMSAVYGIEDVRGYQAMTFAPWRNTYDLWSVVQPIWFNRVDDLTRPFLSMMNVRFAFAPAGAALPNGWKKIGAQPGTQLLENTHALPRAFVPRRVRVNAEVPVLDAEMMAENDFAERAWIAIPGEPSLEAENGSGRVEIEKRGMRRFRLRTSMQRPAWVVITELAWKGWRAYIDGKPTRIHRANQAFLAIFVPAGTHRVRLEYLPQSFVVGRAITGTTTCFLLLWWSRRAIAGTARRRRDPLSRSDTAESISRRGDTGD